jgi:F-type H+-transporting ATPase subunit a
MHEPELFITQLLNNNLAGLGNSLIGLVGMAPQERPWANYVAMQLLVALIVIVLFAILKPRLSVERPGILQHTFELVHEFVSGQADENVGHDGHRYTAYFGTVFIFVLLQPDRTDSGIRIAHHDPFRARGTGRSDVLLLQHHGRSG